MQTLKRLAPSAALALASLVCSPAFASCPAKSIVGTWKDTYGTVATITSKTKGTAITAGIICNGPNIIYTLALTHTGSPPTTVYISGQPPKNSTCPAVKMTLTYNANTCTTASGPIDFEGLQLPDSWSKTASQRSRERQQNPAMTQGLR